MAQNQTLLESFKLPLTRSCPIPLNLGLVSFFPSSVWWGCYLWVGLGQTFIISSSLNFLSFAFRDREPEGVFSIFFWYYHLTACAMCILYAFFAQCSVCKSCDVYFARMYHHRQCLGWVDGGRACAPAPFMWDIGALCVCTQRRRHY